jgi:hypothetical protein
MNNAAQRRHAIMNPASLLETLEGHWQKKVIKTTFEKIAQEIRELCKAGDVAFALALAECWHLATDYDTRAYKIRLNKLLRADIWPSHDGIKVDGVFYAKN